MRMRTSSSGSARLANSSSSRVWSASGVDSVAMRLHDSAKELIRAGALGHLVTSNPDGRPQVTCVWVAVEGDELLTAHLNPRQRKLENVRRNPGVALSFEGTRIQPPGLREYVVVHGRATIEEGGAPELLQELAHVVSGSRCPLSPDA